MRDTASLRSNGMHPSVLHCRVFAQAVYRLCCCLSADAGIPDIVLLFALSVALARHVVHCGFLVALQVEGFYL